MFNFTVITVFIGQYKFEVSYFQVVFTQNIAHEVWNVNTKESVKKKRMNDSWYKFGFNNCGVCVGWTWCVFFLKMCSYKFIIA
jgi:hypothetical protein